MPQRVVPRLWTPSYKSGFARNAAESQFPNLWKGLVGAWVPALGNTGITTLRDVSGYGNHGTMNGSMTAADWVAGEKGLALDFDAVDDYINCGFVPDGSVGTFVCVAKPYSLIPLDLASSGDTSTTTKYWRVIVDTALYINVRDGVNDVVKSATTTISVNNWYHFAVSSDGSSFQLYINAVQQAKTVDVGTDSGRWLSSVSGRNDYFLGALQRSTIINWFDGKIADSRLYNRVLTPSEIAQDYANHLAPFRLKPLTISLPAAAPATTTAVSVARNWTPSYKSGFARNAAESANPGLWKGLVGAWVPALGNTGIATLRDVSGKQNHGTFNGSMTAADWVVGEKGLTLDFDGVNDYINCGDNDLWSFGDSSTDRPFSVTAWVYCRQFAAGKGGFISKLRDSTTDNCEWTLNVNSTGALNFLLYDNTTAHQIRILGTSTLSLNTWHFICATYDGSGNNSGLATYIDGKATGDSGSDVGTYVAMHSTTTPVTIGVILRDSSGRWMNGLISYASIYNRQLKPSEISDLYANPLAPFRLKPLTISLPAAAPPAAPFLPYFKSEPIKSPILQM